MKKYIIRTKHFGDRVLAVEKVFNEDYFMTHWGFINYYHDKKGNSRSSIPSVLIFKYHSKLMPKVKIKEEAQKNLDAYAKKMKLEECLE